MAVVGIDLGTTNTVVACVRDGQVCVLADEEGHHLLPSVVSFHPNGDVLVGREAKLRRLVDAKHTVASIKRLIGRPWDSDEMRIARSRFAFELREGPGQGALVVARGETYTLPEISAFVLKRARQIAEAALGETVDKAVITVPAHFNELQRASTKVAGRVAGLEVLRILNEPTAAALAYGFGNDRSERIAVYDFGGGTFDCSILDLTGNLFEVLATSGDTFLGGDDIDTSIADVMCSAFLAEHRYDPRVDPQAFERLRAAAEELKRSLSETTEAQIDIPDVAHGVEGRALGFTFGMTQADLDAIASPFIERTFEVTQDALSVANLSPSSLDKVVMVGGSTRMAVVARRVARFFGIPVYDKVNPDEVVAVGAAVQAAALVDLGRSRSLPAAPTPGVIGPPPRMPAHAVPGARTAAPQKRVETLRPKPPTLFPSIEPPAPDATPGEGTVTTTLEATGEERSIATAPRGVLPLDDDTGERSFGSNQTLPAGVSPYNIDEPLSTTNIRVDTVLGAAPPAHRPAPSVAQRPLPPPPQRKNTAFQESNTLKARAPTPLSPKHGIVRPLDTDDISLIGVTAVTMQKTSNPPPSSPDSQSLSPRGARVGPLATEDISMLVPDGPGAFRNDLSSTFASPTHLDPAPFPARVAPREAPPPLPRGRPPAPPPAAATFASFGAEPPPFSPAPAAEPAPFAPPPFAWPPLGESPPLQAAAPVAPPVAEPFADRFSFDMPPPVALAEPVRKEWPKPTSPILVDVTPATLLVETVGGYCDTVIARNARIPCEHTRVFATGRDQQTTVQVRVAQGEEERFDANQYLGEVELTGLRPASRGDVLLSVTFEIDANGSLVVSAVDSSTGRKVKAAMKLITVTQSEDMIEEMIERSRSVSVKARST